MCCKFIATIFVWAFNSEVHSETLPVVQFGKYSLLTVMYFNVNINPALVSCQ